MSRNGKHKSRPPRAPVEPGMQGTAIELALDRKLLKRGWWFDAEEADRVCAFFEHHCRHSKGEWFGKALALEPWQKKHVRRLFGWRRPNGTRRYRRAFFGLPKKNGKSTLAAGLGLYLLTSDGEMGAEIYSAASNKEQADIVFTEAQNMVDASATLRNRCEVFTAAIYVPATLSAYRVLSAKPSSKHGFNVHGLIFDEIHALANRSLYDVLSHGVVSRRQPLEFVITTAGDDIGAFGYEMWEYACKCRDGIYEDPEFLAVIYAAGDDDDWEDEATWRKANPNLGVSVDVETLRGIAAKCRGMPGAIASFKQLHLNIWAQSTKAWLDLPKWRKCGGVPQDLAAYAGRKCYGGLDLSSTTDLTALGLIFPGKDGTFDAWVRFWCPEEGVQVRARADRVQYPLWVQQGFIVPTPGNVVDYDRVRAEIVEVSRQVQLLEVAYDPWRATQLAQQLQDDHGLVMVEVRQGYQSFAEPTAAFERLVLSRRLRHPDNPVLTWMASNVVVRKDPAGNMKPDKEKSRERIDGIVALVMALARATLAEDTTSVYESRGIRTL